MPNKKEKHKRIEPQYKAHEKRYVARIPESLFDAFNGTYNNPRYITPLEQKEIEGGDYVSYGHANSAFINRVLSEYDKVINHKILGEIITIFQDNGHELTIREIDEIIRTLDFHKRDMEMHRKMLTNQLVFLAMVKREPFTTHDYFDNWCVNELEEKLRQEENSFKDREGNYTFPDGYKPFFIRPYE